MVETRGGSVEKIDIALASIRMYVTRMSAVEMAMEKVRRLDEPHARELLAWLEAKERKGPDQPGRGAMAALGFARRFRAERRSTAEWMRELRAGESD